MKIKLAIIFSVTSFNIILSIALTNDISGIVYLDENGDKEYNAGEKSLKASLLLIKKK